jgi:hypothetical protein
MRIPVGTMKAASAASGDAEEQMFAMLPPDEPGHASTCSESNSGPLRVLTVGSER